MRIFLKNIGKIDNAEVDIDGITVIAGENDTGKSTVGRALFAVIKSFYHIDEKIQEERAQGIESVIAAMGKQFLRKMSFTLSFHKKDLVHSILSKADSLKDDVNLIKDVFYQSLFLQDKEIPCELDSKEAEHYFLKIKQYLNISDHDIVKSILERTLDVVFRHQVSNIYTGEDGKIQMQIKEKRIEVVVSDNIITDITNGLNLQNQAVYLDGMFVVNDSLNSLFNLNLKSAGENGSLYTDIHADSPNVIEEIVINKKLDKIYSKILSVCSGDLVSNQRLQFGYKRSNSDEILDLANLSAGLKTFALLKYFLKNDIIQSGGILVLDEPEVHLHPEWQLLFAELIVLIYKEFDVQVLLNTHSPYFLRAIQVYSAKYGAADQCRYYLAQSVGDKARVMDATDEIDRIYHKLSQPLQQLENERWQDD